MHTAPRPMHYDAIIIGAGMSGLAAGIRLAHFDKRVCIVEKHYAYGGLNSYYRLRGRDYDVGLHAVTNYVPPGDRSTPLAKLLRQLRLTREDFDLRPQTHSEIRFPDCTLRFSNDVDLLVEQVSQAFPRQSGGFLRLLDAVRSFDDTRLDQPHRSAHDELRHYLSDPLLIDMLLCPMMYYGSAEEHDMEFTQFVTLFKSIFLQGFARPREGVRRIIRTLVRKYRACGGKLRMRCGVDKLQTSGGSVTAIVLDGGETVTADVVLSSAGYPETMRLCGDPAYVAPAGELGTLSFVETIAILDQPPSRLGFAPCVAFYNDGETFTYARPDEPVDLRSGVLCSPNNYADHEHLEEGVFRVTWLANHEPWLKADEQTYLSMKEEYRKRFIDRARRVMPSISDHIVDIDMFTPRTVHRFTGHINGAVYGSPRKRRDGRTPLDNLFICGTDQGFLGIIGAMLSGITVANLHVLANE